MAILQDQDVRFKHLERKIGTFVLVALAGVVLTIIGIGMKQELFTPRTTIHFITDSAQDIAAGTAVKLRGFDIGKVEKLALTDDARVQVTLSIRGDNMKWVRKDSKARLVKEGFIGAAIIDISPGSAQAPVLQKNELIAFNRETGLGDVVTQLRDEVVPILQDVKRLTHALQDPNGDFRQALHHTNVVLANLPETQKKLNSVLSVAADELPRTLRSTRETVEGTKKIVDSVSRTWPISRNIEPTKPKTLRPDSYEATNGNGKKK
ncbi:MAG: MCE family protein [Gammaproteobacteria bacterium]|nr:MAG: MCE family protein [Gammaproteobacteria bacterium]